MVGLGFPTKQVDCYTSVVDYDTILAQHIGYYLNFYRKNKLRRFSTWYIYFRKSTHQSNYSYFIWFPIQSQIKIANILLPNQQVRSILGALVFYTIIPLPQNWQLEFTRIARWSPLIGLFIGSVLGLSDLGLASLSVPLLTRSALVVGFWLFLTGGLHLDGAIDTADGLAVLEPQRRLQVMSDSVTGAFGVMAAIIILLLKTSALYDLSLSIYRFPFLILAAGWGRWAQVRAIAHYPYLKETGKGAFHKQAMHLPQDMLLGFTFLLGLSGLWLWLDLTKWWLPLTGTIVGSLSAICVGAWFNHQLGGHTGDTYGATVEWTETIILCLLTIFT